MDILSTILNFYKPISKKLFNESASNWGTLKRLKPERHKSQQYRLIS
jgi:hypothetical protein